MKLTFVEENRSHLLVLSSVVVDTDDDDYIVGDIDDLSTFVDNDLLDVHVVQE